ncbi:MAG: helix-turn-helix transcriptional regulator [Candidatus Gastranaerophilaceae bacterium]|nr:helix-turn-helix transcriptional regulator [Candidatus Gastranaerophilaceae bacterium]
MKKDNTFGKKLKQIRISKGLSQAKLAEMADVHEKHISKIETGRFHPNFDTLSKILNALDLRLEDVSIDSKNVSTNGNPSYIKSLQILNNSTEKELEFYYNILRQCQKSLLSLQEK